MNEAETRAERIDPALAAAGWGTLEGSRVRRECPITLGRLEGRGRWARGMIADYPLEYRNRTLAVVEAEALGEGATEGLAQAKVYAGKLGVRFAYATDGEGIYAVDMETGREGEIAAFPTPEALCAATFAEANAWRDRFAAVPFEDKGGSHPARYYQQVAVERVLQAISEGRRRILLTLATGTGKTFIAFQIAWKLFEARWNLSGEPSRRPRILSLADRNILADQAYNAFSAFAEDALVRIAPDDVRKKGRVPKNGSLFLTIFQTFLSGPPRDGKPSPYFGEYPPDFFDFIVIDECHRGGANDESTWRGIMEYFAPAVQLGLTATPKREENADTYRYFGEPVYTYSLEDGINDGFLTPFRVKQIQTTLGSYIFFSFAKSFLAASGGSFATVRYESPRIVPASRSRGGSLLVEEIAIEARHLDRLQRDADSMVDHQLGEARAINEHEAFGRLREVKRLRRERRGRDQDDLARTKGCQCAIESLHFGSIDRSTPPLSLHVDFLESQPVQRDDSVDPTVANPSNRLQIPACDAISHAVKHLKHDPLEERGRACLEPFEEVSRDRLPNLLYGAGNLLVGSRLDRGIARTGRRGIHGRSPDGRPRRRQANR
jgi:hypothetical protein